MSKKIVITGASGVVGSKLLDELLKTDASVTVLYRDENFKNSTLQKYSQHPAGKLKLLKGDVLDYPMLLSAIEGSHEVYHCAAVVSFWKPKYRAMRKTNIEGTANVVNACLETSKPKLCFVSSIAALGRPTAGSHINEETEWVDSPYNSVYAITKMLAEAEVWRGNAEGLETVIVNPGIILGEGDWHRSSLRIFRTLRKRFYFYPDGTNGFVDVRDVVTMMTRLMESNISGEKFIAVSANLKFGELFGKIAEGYGLKPPSIKVGSSLAFVGAFVLDLASRFTGKEPILTFETARNSQADFFYDGTKITQHLKGFSYIPFDETIARSCAYFSNKAE